MHGGKHAWLIIKLVKFEFLPSRDNEADVSSVCASPNENHSLKGGNSTPIIMFYAHKF